MIRVTGLAAALCICDALPALADGPRQLECTASASGMAHRLRLTVGDGGEVAAFEYSSVDVATANGCAVAASRTPDGGLAVPMWTARPDGATQVDIQTFATGTESILGTVTIRRVDGGYALTANPPVRFCARGAYLAPLVTLTVGDNRCRLGEAGPAALNADAAQAVTLSADTDQAVLLTGRLRQERRWGPPNFGESPKTDSMFVAWILELPRPVVIHAHEDESKPRRDVALKRIQLHEVSVPTEGWKAKLGKVVLVSGKLSPASTGGDVTDVTLDVEDLRLMDSGR